MEFELFASIWKGKAMRTLLIAACLLGMAPAALAQEVSPPIVQDEQGQLPANEASEEEMLLAIRNLPFVDDDAGQFCGAWTSPTSYAIWRATTQAPASAAGRTPVCASLENVYMALMFERYEREGTVDAANRLLSAVQLHDSEGM